MVGDILIFCQINNLQAAERIRLIALNYLGLKEVELLPIRLLADGQSLCSSRKDFYNLSRYSRKIQLFNFKFLLLSHLTTFWKHGQQTRAQICGKMWKLHEFEIKQLNSSRCIVLTMKSIMVLDVRVDCSWYLPHWNLPTREKNKLIIIISIKCS